MKPTGKVLVVDDDPRNLDIICHLLEEIAFEVVTACDAKMALQKLETYDADLALLDIMMPGMNGYELCQLVKEKYPNLKVVLVSAKASIEERMKGYEVGADDYIPKPFDHDEFMAKIQILLRLQKVENELRKLNQDLETRVLERTAEVQNMYQQLLLSSKLATLGELSASIAHEINNPLTILRGNIDYLRESLEKMGDRSFIPVLDQQDCAVNRIVNIIQGLRRHARQDTSDIVNFNAHKEIEETLSLFRPLLGGEAIRLEVSLAADSPFIRGNPTRFQQILLNLLTNARDALGEVKGGLIQVESRSVGDKLELVVSDNGAGIAEELKNKIFDPFFTTKDTEHGTGLGLSIVGSIISEMNGTVQLKSEQGKGAKFLLTFPGLRADEVLFDRRNSEGETKKIALKGTALVVEDEEVIAQLVGRYLRDLGLEVSVVFSGEAALEKLRRESFDLILTDIQLPHLKGDELVVEAKKLGRLGKSRVIAVTGKLEGTQTDKSGKRSVNGFDALLAKPFSKGDVYEIVRGLL